MTNWWIRKTYIDREVTYIKKTLVTLRGIKEEYSSGNSNSGIKSSNVVMGILNHTNTNMSKHVDDNRGKTANQSICPPKKLQWQFCNQNGIFLKSVCSLYPFEVSWVPQGRSLSCYIALKEAQTWVPPASASWVSLCLKSYQKSFGCFL